MRGMTKTETAIFVTSGAILVLAIAGLSLMLAFWF